jgi:hypothetical protein
MNDVAVNSLAAACRSRALAAYVSGAVSLQ